VQGIVQGVRQKKCTAVSSSCGRIALLLFSCVSHGVEAPHRGEGLMYWFPFRSVRRPPPRHAGPDAPLSRVLRRPHPLPQAEFRERRWKKGSEGRP